MIEFGNRMVDKLIEGQVKEINSKDLDESDSKLLISITGGKNILI